MGPLIGIDIIKCREGNPKGVVKSWILYEDLSTVIIDTGMDEMDADRIRRALAELGKSFQDINAIVLTHRHGDHIGGLPFLHSKSEIPILAHEGDQPQITNETGLTVQNLPVAPLKWLPDVEVIHAPGHTPGTIMLYWRPKKTLIAGDAIFSAGGHLIPPPHYLCDDPDMAKQSLERLLKEDMEIECILVSHGEDVFEGGKTRLARIQAPKR
jgi:glyoxylase-like metal-dependent hydrolase (beta-lactamase superfamily II)